MNQKYSCKSSQKFRIVPIDKLGNIMLALTLVQRLNVTLTLFLRNFRKLTAKNTTKLGNLT